jgi:hypothetical protein
MTSRKEASSGMLRRVALLRTDVSMEHSATIIRVIRVQFMELLVMQFSPPSRITDQQISLTCWARSGDVMCFL